MVTDPVVEPAVYQGNEKPHSVEIQRDAKGVYRWSIKVYFGDDVTEMHNVINSIDETLRTRYAVG